MAAIFDEITISTLKAYGDLNAGLLDTDSALVRILQERERTMEGDPIPIQVRHKRNPGKSYGPYDATDVNPREQFAEGKTEWREIRVSMTIAERHLQNNIGMNLDQLEEFDSLSSLPGGHSATIFNLFFEKLQGGMLDMRTLLASQVYGDGSGNGGLDITGLDAVISHTTDYGNMTVSELGTFDKNGLLSGVKDNIWAARRKTLSSQGITLDDLGLGLSDANRGRADRIEFVFMPLDIWQTVELLLEGQRRRENEFASRIGFSQNIEWVSHGATFLADDHCPENTIFGVNFNHTWMAVAPTLNMHFSGFNVLRPQRVVYAELIHQAQIVCDDRAKNLRLDDVEP